MMVEMKYVFLLLNSLRFCSYIEPIAVVPARTLVVIVSSILIFSASVIPSAGFSVSSPLYRCNREASSVRCIGCRGFHGCGSTLFLSSNSASDDNGSGAVRSQSGFVGGKVPKNVATRILQGVGPVRMETLNRLNVPYEVAINEWTVCRVMKADSSVPQLRLECKNDSKDDSGSGLTAGQTSSLYVDTGTTTFPRKKGEGLGIELLEIASLPETTGNENTFAVGITVVSGLVEHGAAAAADSESILIPGDVLSSVTIARSIRKTNVAGVGTTVQEKEQLFVTPVPLECLGYDSTVAAIRGVVNAADNAMPSAKALGMHMEDTFIITFKRIRRKPKVLVKFQFPPSSTTTTNDNTGRPVTTSIDTIVEFYAGENLRQGAMIRGIQLNDENTTYTKRFDTKVDGNCGANGLCRTCTVAIVRGAPYLNPMRHSERQIMSSSPRGRLSCKTIVGYGMEGIMDVNGSDDAAIVVRVYPNRW